MKIILFITLSLSLFASNINSKLLNYYKNERYQKACNYGMNHFNKFMHDEAMVSLYAFSCLKADYIDRTTTPIALLKKSEEARKNAAYLATILMQKKLLYHSLIDNYSLKSVQLPSTDYLLSKVFTLYSEGKYTQDKKVFYLKSSKNSKISYKLYLIKKRGINKIVIESYYDKILSEKHIYR